MRSTLSRRPARLAVALAGLAAVAVWQLPAADAHEAPAPAAAAPGASPAAVEEPLDTAVTGNATWFDALGDPYGGCGMPQKDLETQHFIALNVYNTPNVYEFYTRPMPAGDPKIGIWNNGHNCGRWVEVTIGDYCTGVNDGNPGLAFCRQGDWVSDKYNDAKLQMIVADSCGDSNAWCRDDPYHIDLHHSSVNAFVKDGAAVGDLDTTEHWNNRHVSWKFIPAPDYTGDIQIGFLAGSKPGWTAIAVSHLANGIHGVDYWFEDAWHPAEMDGDMGQAFIVKPHNTGETRYSVRVKDVDDKYLNDGRVYTVDLPKTCSPQCADAYLKVPYTTGTTPPGSDLVKSCTAAPKVTKSWDGGYQAEVTVTAGEAKIRGWSVSWTLPDGQSISDVWNGARTVTGQQVTVKNLEWNGTIEAGGKAVFGVLVKGGGTPPAMTCTPAA